MVRIGALALCLMGMLFAESVAACAADAYPTRPVRWVVPFPPGGATDILTRIMAQFLSERLGQPVIIENRPGGGTNIAAQAVINSPPDGYTMLLVVSSSTVNATLYESLPFNFLRDIAPVGGFTSQPFVIIASPSLPAKTIRNSLPMPKPIPARSTWARSAPGQSAIWRSSC